MLVGWSIDVSDKKGGGDSGEGLMRRMNEILKSNWIGNGKEESLVGI